MLFNQAAGRFVGKAPQEVVGKDDRAIFPPDQAEMLMNKDRHIRETCRADSSVEALDTPTGRRIFQTIKGPLNDASGRTIGTFGISRDITENATADAAIKASEAKYRDLVDKMFNSLAHCRVIFAGNTPVDIEYIAVNPAFYRITGIGGDVVGRCISEIIPGYCEGNAESLAVFGRVARSRQPCQWEHYLSQLDRWFSFMIYPTGGPDEIIILTENINERKKAELALKESEARFHDIATASADWVWEVDAQGRYRYMSDSVENVLGYTPDDMLGKTPFDFMPPEEAERMRTLFQAIAEKKAPFRDLDNINRHKDGSLRHIWTNGMPVLDGNGSLIGYRGLDRDITTRRQIEIALKDAKERLRTLVDTLPDLVWLKDTNGVYLACNRRFEQFFGAPEKDIIGRTDYDFVPRELADFFREHDKAALAAAAPSTNEEEVAFASDGHREWLHTVKTPLLDGAGETIGVLGIARDITAIKATEAELKMRNDELAHFNRAMVGREMDVIGMKKTINALCRELGREPPYPLSFLRDGESP